MSTKYRYANGSKGRLIDVLTLDDSIRHHFGPYKCIGCDGELIPVLPTKNRVKHFKHKVDDNCSPETYLHRLGKHLFYQEYKHCLSEGISFIYEFKTQFFCTHYKKKLGVECKSTKTVQHDLTTVFNQIDIEKRANGFQPDIRLYSSESEHQIFVEIAVTHKCEQQKIDSGVRIIEIKLEDESDLECIAKHHLSEADNDKIITHNMQKKSVQGDYCQGNCERHLELVSIDRHKHKATVKVIKPWEYDERYKLFHIVGLLDGFASEMEQRLTDKLHELKHDKKENFKDCCFCIHKSGGSYTNVRCSKQSPIEIRTIRSNEASTCSHYLEG